MPDKYDLHCHSTASDGALAPAEVVRRAHLQGVTALALTDHDTTAGLQEAARAASDCGMRFIPGIELSAIHAHQCLHIIGLNIDAAQPILVEGLVRQQNLREQRALKIAEKLHKKGMAGAYEAVTQAAGRGEITRSHFADFLVAQGYVASQQDAFDRYLSKGKPAFVPTQWAGLDEVVDWIRAAGGIAVLAHPLRYNLSFKWMNKALSAFKQFGGQGVEVVTGRASDDDIRLSLKMVQQHKLFASVGSDFHTPENPWVELGRLAPLPAEASPVWSLFPTAAEFLA
ncbi:PHP domain-containing protein [Methylomonas sp. SURF-2]|uniref:PHP domain-containing protein n=1 Tax=Methylomonas subterranea TaxID=2952225 RepID=A0ABT1TC82_9GAMM|nr:PHP domain-containing protein [Methylomonas sp. SURF-2]MCQ8103020.1 PHP domain-containing protein [Methylomonas sp. SURF-2]